MKQESLLMLFFRAIQLDSIAWSLRRLYVPVQSKDLVLEVGSGANPYFRSNVLLDAYENTQERHWTPLIKDRPTVLGFVENLPFKDQSFDFIIASHVLEHSKDPEKFLTELMRVGKAGYIEVPHALMERLTSYYDHRMELLVEEGVLKIWKKSNWLVDPLLREFLLNKPNEVLSQHLLSKKPFHFHVRLYWQNKIQYQIMNPEVNSDWQAPQSTVSGEYSQVQIMAKIKLSMLKVFRYLFSQHRRNLKIDLLKIIRCPKCYSSSLEFNGQIQCTACQMKFDGGASFVNFVK